MAKPAAPCFCRYACYLVFLPPSFGDGSPPLSTTPVKADRETPMAGRGHMLAERVHCTAAHGRLQPMSYISSIV